MSHDGLETTRKTSSSYIISSGACEMTRGIERERTRSASRSLGVMELMSAFANGAGALRKCSTSLAVSGEGSWAMCCQAAERPAATTRGLLWRGGSARHFGGEPGRKDARGPPGRRERRQAGWSTKARPVTLMALVGQLLMGDLGWVGNGKVRSRAQRTDVHTVTQRNLI